MKIYDTIGYKKIYTTMLELNGLNFVNEKTILLDIQWYINGEYLLNQGCSQSMGGPRRIKIPSRKKLSSDFVAVHIFSEGVQTLLGTLLSQGVFWVGYLIRIPKVNTLKINCNNFLKNDVIRVSNPRSLF